MSFITKVYDWMKELDVESPCYRPNHAPKRDEELHFMYNYLRIVCKIEHGEEVGIVVGLVHLIPKSFVELHGAKFKIGDTKAMLEMHSIMKEKVAILKKNQ